jgi:short-subunit dehydrogenase
MNGEHESSGGARDRHAAASEAGARHHGQEPGHVPLPKVLVPGHRWAVLVAPGILPCNATLVARVLLTLEEAASSVRRARSPIRHEPRPLRSGPTFGSRRVLLMSEAPSFRSRYGPCALIAGAAVGLGAEWARQTAARGLDVVVLDRDGDAVQRTADEIGERHAVEVRAVVFDLARSDLIEAIRAETSGLEIGLLVCNAACSVVAPFLELEAAQLQAMLDVNCRAPLLLAHALAPPMVRRGRGGIVLMSSLSGNIGSAQLAVYAASKAFDLVLADALWVELRSHGVDVLAVQPGSTRTPGWLVSQPADAEQTLPVMEPADVVREGLDALGVEPGIVPGELNRQGAEALARLPRRQAIELMSAITGALVPNNRAPVR